MSNKIIWRSVNIGDFIDDETTSAKIEEIFQENIRTEKIRCVDIDSNIIINVSNKHVKIIIGNIMRLFVLIPPMSAVMINKIDIKTAFFLKLRNIDKFDQYLSKFLFKFERIVRESPSASSLREPSALQAATAVANAHLIAVSV
jgi:hypothetical protein